MKWEGRREEDQPNTVPAFIISDMRTRLLHLETNIPPRVQALETAVSEMTNDLRAIRKEMSETRQETRTKMDQVHSAIQTENRAIQAQTQANRTASEALQAQLQSINRRLTFGSGALWAMGALLGLIAYHWDALARLVELLEKAQ